MKRNFMEMLRAKWAEGKFVCVGLDSDHTKLPKFLYSSSTSLAGMLMAFNARLVEATQDLVLAYKLNTAFYEAHGEAGWKTLKWTITRIHEIAPDVPVILDAKRADIGNTNEGYVNAAFCELQADAITVHPYLGQEALKPFLDREDKGVIVLCRTSNPGAGEFQDLRVRIPGEELDHICRVGAAPWSSGESGDYTNMSNHVAYQIAKHWNENSNCAVVVGATYPRELAEVRKIVGDMPILIPGIGAQGGDVEATVKAGKDSKGGGMIINSSRGIIFASNDADFAEAARRETQKLHNLINQYR